MSELSTEVENILTTFRDKFEMVKNEPKQLIINVFSPYLITYIVSVLRSLFISHILVFLVLIIQHIVPKIYTLGAKCSFYGVKCMLAVKKRESIKYFPFQNLIYRLLN